MNKVLKILGGLLGLVIIVISGALFYFSMSWGKTYPETPTPQISAVDDPAVIERGRYLFHSAAHCSSCHAPRDEVEALQTGDEAVPRGSEIPMGPLATLRPPNLTNCDKTGIGRYSDAELARVIRHGVKPDDTVALMMIAAGPMSDEDLTALISYMRTIDPVVQENDPSEVYLMGKVIMQTAAAYMASPKPDIDAPAYVPSGQISAGRGKYLAEGPAACFGCHSNVFAESFDSDKYFCGNPEPWPDPEQPNNEIYAPNITTHAGTGKLAGVSEDDFIARMKAPRMYAGSPMPWENYRSMTEDDLRSIYRYLTSREPCDRDVGPVYRTG